MSQQPPPKRDVMIALLQQADSVFVQFDPRREGVIIPAHLKRQPRVVLQYGMNMAIPIPDLEVNEQGIGATLSFSHTPSWTFVPWSAVFAIVSNDQQHGMLWEADVPHDPEADGRQRAESGAAASKTKAARGGAKGRPALRAIRGDEPAAPAAGASTAAETPADAPASEPAKTDASDAPAAAAPIEQAPPPAASPADSDAPSESKADDVVEPPAREQPRKKRELPPYLRVVT